jgi:hypothetical protein
MLGEVFDEAKITADAVFQRDLTVRYGGEYAGAVTLQSDGTYRCSVSVAEGDHRVLQGCGTADSPDEGAQWVGLMYWHRRIAAGEPRAAVAG